jgi:hypothetical protein
MDELERALAFRHQAHSTPCVSDSFVWGTGCTDDCRRDKLGGGAIEECGLGVVPGAAVAAGSSRFAVVNASRRDG